LDISLKSKLLMCRIVFIIAIINFFAYLVMTTRLGGDAVNGKFENGHYYLANHGRLTEVSKEVFNYSRWHTYSLWITHPLAVLAAYLSIKLKKEQQPK
jgi:hypothetical protein